VQRGRSHIKKNTFFLEDGILFRARTVAGNSFALSRWYQYIEKTPAHRDFFYYCAL